MMLTERQVSTVELERKVYLALTGQGPFGNQSFLANIIVGHLKETLDSEESTCVTIAHKIDRLRERLRDLKFSLLENCEPEDFAEAE